MLCPSPEDSLQLGAGGGEGAQPGMEEGVVTGAGWGGGGGEGIGLLVTDSPCSHQTFRFSRMNG